MVETYTPKQLAAIWGVDPKRLRRAMRSTLTPLRVGMDFMSPTFYVDGDMMSPLKQLPHRPWVITREMAEAIYKHLGR
jgi:hypothetical protein